MPLSPCIQQPEVRAERSVQFFRRVTHDIQPAAAGWSILGKGGDDGATARPKCTAHLVHVCRAGGGVGQKVKDCPVVPEINGGRREACRQYVRLDPFDPIGPRPQSIPRLAQGCWRDIEHCQVAVTGVEEPVHQRGRSAAHVENRGLLSGHLLDQSQ